MPEQHISFFSEDCGFALKNQSKHINWVLQSLDKEAYKSDYLNFIFCSDEYLLNINIQYLNHDYYTDIITFDNSEDDKIAVSRARKIERFFSQPMYVAEQFTNLPGKYVPIKETVRGFSEILDGKHDHLPEDAFMLVGTIDEAVEKAERIEAA